MLSLGAYGRFLLGDRWYLEAELRGISLEFGDYEVDLLEGGAAFRHFFSRTVGAELGYDLGYYHQTADQISHRGFFELDFRGKFDYLVHGFHGGIVIQL